MIVKGQKSNNMKGFVGAGWIFLLLISCQTKRIEVVVQPAETVNIDLSAIGKEKLSDYGLFTGPLRNLTASPGVIPYSLNSSLFTDYAFKKRFIKIPPGTKAIYRDDDVFDFPDGTVLIKNFYYPLDFRMPGGNLQILETRLLINEKGKWTALPYVWNAEQTEAYLNVAGKTMAVKWTHYDGMKRQVNYSVPNQAQCKGCHMRGDQIKPIGPAARQLNGALDNAAGRDNQLVEWQELNVLKGVPPLTEVPVLAAYGNVHESIERRARAWLEINCAHCHREDGPARNSGLYLLASVKDGMKLGIGKAPVAAGKGSGGLLYGIVPGKPDESILLFRIQSTNPGIMMPELGRTLVHEEGVEIIREWISEMKK